MNEVELRQQIQLDAGVLSDPYWQGQRITNLINQAQEWLQLKLIKQGFRNWNGETPLTFSNGTLLYEETSTATLPTDILYDMPIESIMPIDQAVKPATEIQLKNFIEVANNGVIAPTVTNPIFIVVDVIVHLYPRGTSAGGKMTYTKKVLDLTFNDTTDSTIPNEHQQIIVERVVMQIKSANGQEDIKQAKNAEVGQYLAERYQIDALKEVEDKKGEQ